MKKAFEQLKGQDKTGGGVGDTSEQGLGLRDPPGQTPICPGGLGAVAPGGGALRAWPREREGRRWGWGRGRGGVHRGSVYPPGSSDSPSRHSPSTSQELAAGPSLG